MLIAIVVDVNQFYADIVLGSTQLMTTNESNYIVSDSDYVYGNTVVFLASDASNLSRFVIIG